MIWDGDGGEGSGGRIQAVSGEVRSSACRVDQRLSTPQLMLYFGFSLTKRGWNPRREAVGHHDGIRPAIVQEPTALPHCCSPGTLRLDPCFSGERTFCTKP